MSANFVGFASFSVFALVVLISTQGLDAVTAAFVAGLHLLGL